MRAELESCADLEAGGINIQIWSKKNSPFCRRRPLPRLSNHLRKRPDTAETHWHGAYHERGREIVLAAPNCALSPCPYELMAASQCS